MQQIQELHYTFCKNTLALKGDIEKGFLSLSERLYKIREEQMFRPTWETFGEYVKEMKMSESTASKLVSIYENMILGFGINPEKILAVGGWSIAYTISKTAKTKEDAERLIEEGQHKTREDLEKDIKEHQTGISQIDCPCDSDFYIIKICKKCGKKIKVFTDTELTAESLKELR